MWYRVLVLIFFVNNVDSARNIRDVILSKSVLNKSYVNNHKKYDYGSSEEITTPKEINTKKPITNDDFLTFWTKKIIFNNELEKVSQLPKCGNNFVLLNGSLPKDFDYKDCEQEVKDENNTSNSESAENAQTDTYEQYADNREENYYDDYYVYGAKEKNINSKEEEYLEYPENTDNLPEDVTMDPTFMQNIFKAYNEIFNSNNNDQTTVKIKQTSTNNNSSNNNTEFSYTNQSSGCVTYKINTILLVLLIFLNILKT